MNVQIEESWKTHLQPEFDKDYFRTLTEFVKSEYSQYQIFPPGRLIFNAFNLCPCQIPVASVFSNFLLSVRS